MKLLKSNIAVYRDILGWLQCGINSPRHRCACHPSLRFAHRGDFIFFHYLLSAAGEERVVQRSVDRVSQLYDLN